MRDLSIMGLMWGHCFPPWVMLGISCQGNRKKLWV